MITIDYPITFKFRGMNNVDDPTEVGAPTVEKGKLTFAEGVSMINLDSDNQFRASMRPGQIQRYSGSILSAFSNDDTFLIHQGYFLKRFYPETYTTAILKIGMSTLRPAVFCEVNGVIVYTDGTMISRIYQGIDYPMPVPTDQFKLPTPAGQCLALFFRRLLIGVIDELCVTDPDTVEQMDKRLCYFPLDGMITAIMPVDDGVYVGTSVSVWHLAGRGPTEWALPHHVTRVAPYPVIPGTDIQLKAELTGMNTSGNIAMFTTTRGICYGLNGGQFINATEEKLQPPSGLTGCAILREQSGVNHYLTILRDTVTTPYNAYAEPLQDFI